MTDTDFEARLAGYLQARAEDAVEPFDASMIADTAIGASRPRDRRHQMVLAAAVVALAVVGTAGAIVVGGLLNQRPNPSPPVDIASPDPSAEASTAPEAGLIVYTPVDEARCRRGRLRIGVSLHPGEHLHLESGRIERAGALPGSLRIRCRYVSRWFPRDHQPA